MINLGTDYVLLTPILYLPYSERLVTFRVAHFQACPACQEAHGYWVQLPGCYNPTWPAR
ncbi:hypothetical protein D3C80_417470 [compost metagenome]